MNIQISKVHFSNVIATTDFIKMKLSEFDERDVLVTKGQYVNAIVATSATTITINTSTSNTNTPMLTTISATSQGLNVKLEGTIRGEDELTHNVLSLWRLSKRRNRNILRTVLCVKLNPTVFVVGDVELTQRKYFHPNATDSTHTTTAPVC